MRGVAGPSKSGAARAIGGAIAVATLVGCGLSLTIALIAVRLDAAGYSGHAIGLNTAAGGVATLVGAPFIPSIARRLGVARLLLAALLVGAMALFAFTLTSDFTSWLVLRFVEGLAVTVMFVLSEFWITSATPSHRRGLTIGLYVTCLGIGFAVGPLILAVSGTAGDLPFEVAAALFVAAAIPLMLTAGEAPPLAARSRKTMLTFLRDAPAATLAGLLHGAIEVAGMGLIPVYAIRSGLSVGQGALFASLFILGNSVWQVPLGLVADRVDRRRLLLALAILGLAGALYLATAGVDHLHVFEAVLLIWGGVVGAFYPVGLGQLGEDYGGAELASANAAYVMTYALGMLVGPPFIGAGLDLVSPAGLFWSIAILIGFYLVVAGRGLVGRPTARPATTPEPS